MSELERHSAFVMDRGGRRRLFELKDISELSWGRERDAMSEASIKLTQDSIRSQDENLATIDPGRHELCIFRDGERAWEGPINLPQFVGKKATIGAKDVLQYANRRAMHAGYSSAYPRTEKVVGRIERIMRAELARKEELGYNILSHLRTYIDDNDAETSAVTKPYQMQVFQHLENLAAKNGIDYTVVGRAIHIWDTSKPKMGRTAVATEADFIGDLRVSLYGAELATRSIVTDGEGNYAATGEDDPYYGEWEILATAYDKDEDEGPPPTIAELKSQSQRNQARRNPTPVVVSVPENSTVNPKGVLTIDQLVPGIIVPLSAKVGPRTLSQPQKLQRMKVTETARGETITVSLYPASQSDELEAILA